MGRLESFNNVVHLNVKPFSKYYWMEVEIWYFCYRDQSSTTRVQLAVLDHNQHLDRGKACNKEGHELYARKFEIRKQTKNGMLHHSRNTKNMTISLMHYDK